MEPTTAAEAITKLEHMHTGLREMSQALDAISGDCAERSARYHEIGHDDQGTSELAARDKANDAASLMVAVQIRLTELMTALQATTS